MREPVQVPVADLVPQAGRMCLLSRALEADKESMVVEATIESDNIFCDAHGVGAWVGLEFMAQAIAACVGWQSHLSGQSPRIGFLLGTRRYRCSRSYFHVGETLRIEATQLLTSDSGMGQFECSILIDGNEVARAALTVYEPRNSSEILGRKENE